MLGGQFLSEHWFTLDSILIAAGMLAGWFLTQLVLAGLRRGLGRPGPVSPTRGYCP